MICSEKRDHSGFFNENIAYSMDIASSMFVEYNGESL